MKVTRHRNRILKALGEFIDRKKEAPTLEELCKELGMQPRQKATVQRWLQTMRGIDVEWDDNVARSLRLISKDIEVAPELEIPVKETLRYLATGLTEWEERKATNRVERGHIPQAMRMGMSRMYLTSLLTGEEQTPVTIPEFFAWAKNPVSEWKPTAEIEYLSPDVTLIEDGTISDFTSHWQVEGADVDMQVQEKVLQDVVEYCRANQLDETYRAFRKLIIERPVLPRSEYRRLISSSQLRPLDNFLRQIYVDVVNFASESVYYCCPRCKYIMRRRADGTYNCRSPFCERLSAKLQLPPQISISQEEAEDWKVVTPGVYRYGTLPGIWEIELAEKLTKMGVRVTLWPEIDEFDLLVEFSKRNRWAIDVKDWVRLNEERLKKVNYRLDTTETFIVFPDERKDVLRIEVERQRLEPDLGGVRLRWMSEIISQAQAILEKNHHA
ncbi:MAG TPA: Fis family transcriptional regulator [Nostocaceae cyanobacterium]|nr:Fis family transcriptional regulator [Nostocaceae cyanobacterium]